MSLMTSLELDRSGKAGAGAVSFVEAIVFCGIAAAFLIGGVMLCALLSPPGEPADAARMNLGAWMGGMGAGISALSLAVWAVLYVLLIFLYWSPPVIETTDGKRIHNYRQPLPAFVKVVAFWVISGAYFALAAYACLALLDVLGWADVHWATPGAFPHSFGGVTRWAWAWVWSPAWSILQSPGTVPMWMWTIAAYGYYLIGAAYWSRLGMPGITIPRVSNRFLGVLTLLAAGVVVYYFVLAGAYVLVGQAMGAKYEGRWWDLAAWLAATRTTIFVLATIVLALIGLFTFRREESPRFAAVVGKLLGPVLPLVKAAMFLLVSAASLAGVVTIFGLLLGRLTSWNAAGDLGVAMGALSAVGMLVLVGGFFLLITAYWVPGRAEANTIELWGFTALLAIGASFCLWRLWAYLATLRAWQDFIAQARGHLGL